MPNPNRSWFQRLWPPKSPPAKQDYDTELEALRQQAPIPVLWLFGKTGSGKSTVARYLTGAEEATIGEGFKPHTRFSRLFDFPDAEQPLLRFLDTRGLGEVNYDPAEDIAAFGNKSQLMLVTVRAVDHSLDDLLGHLRRIRSANKDRPVILVVTCLHQAPGALDIAAHPDPFEDIFDPDRPGTPKPDAHDDEKMSGVPEALQKLLMEKQRQFSGLVDHIVPIDITRPEEGFANPEFGGGRLSHAILHYLPQAYRQALIALRDIKTGSHSARQRKSHRQVLASSALAASAGAIPLPYVDIPAVLGIQSHLAYRIAEIYDQKMTTAHWAILSSATGSRVALRLLARQLLKLIPAVGIAANAAAAFVFTYALGMSWDWYFSQVRKGAVPSSEELKQVFAEQLQRGRTLWEKKPS
jgi:uncharacterized protein (DUF697 family)